MTTPSSSSLSHALNPPTVIQKQSNQDLPRLQLAPPEHQKHLQSQTRLPQEHQQGRGTSVSSSREVSPVVGIENPAAAGDKRKYDIADNSASKKRRTDQEENPRTFNAVQYGLGTHYPFAYGYPGAPPPPPHPTFSAPTPAPPAPNPNPTSEMSFNEFQWRVLNLCGEFYEAATELIRATPHLVLSQAFQLLNRGTGIDPLTVLNDARRTCDMLLASPQALASAPPPPTTLPLPVLTSLSRLSTRGGAPTAPVPATTPVAPPPLAPVITPSYYTPQESMIVGDKNAQKLKEKSSSNVQGTWKDHEVAKLKALAEKYRVRDKTAAAEEEEEEEEEDIEDAEGIPDTEAIGQSTKKPKELGEIDWDKVVAEFGDERSRHQVLIKATYLGLKPSSSLPGKKPKKKKSETAATEPPPPTFSSVSAKSIPVSYHTSQLGTSQSSSASPATGSPTLPGTTLTGAAKPSSSAPTTSTSQRPPAAAPPLHPPQHPIPHPPYGQPGWYPHPQNPYYAYHQPMYYSTQGYGMQGYGLPGQPPQAYYAQPYPPPLGADLQSANKQDVNKGKQKEPAKKSSGNGATTTASKTPVPPPALPPRTVATIDSSTMKQTPVSVPAGASLPAETQASATSTPRMASVASPGNANAPTNTGSSGVLRRGPNNNLFTYTPLPHGPGGPASEHNK